MKLLIVSLDAYSLFDTSTHFIFGGAELRASIFAKELSRLPDVEVTVVTRDQARGNKKFDNILVVPHPEKKGQGYWEQQKKLTTRIKNRLSGSSKEKKETTFFFDSLKPTHVLILGMSPEAVECLKYCSKAKIPFIFGCASDFDLSEEYLKKNSVDISGNSANEYANVLRNASLVLVQSAQQEEMLEKRFGRKGIILPNPVLSELPKTSSKTIPASDVLWVGKTSSVKRPELFLKLAALLPDLKFRMILNNTDSKVWNKLVSEKTNNLEIIESVSSNEIEYYFKQTALFVNTSSVEGFPNTFLQAAKFGVPIISMKADPGQFVSNKKFGILSGDDLDSLKNAVQKLLSDPVLYKMCSDNIRSYVMRVHDAKKVSKELFDQISKLNPPN